LVLAEKAVKPGYKSGLSLLINFVMASSFYSGVASSTGRIYEIILAIDVW